VTLKAVIPYIGHLELRKIHAGSFERYVKDRKAEDISAGTLNRDKSIVQRVINLAAKLWRDEQGRPWLDTTPLFPIHNTKRKPRPISVPEQNRLIKNMPAYLADMTFFEPHTGLWDQEICGMRWDYEAKVNELDTTIFIITEERAKNEDERIVPLNAAARPIVNNYRGQSEFVFQLKGNRLDRMNNRAWRKARESTGIPEVRFHDLRHTFGMRLRTAGVSLEDRQDLLGHYAGRITMHYSRVEIARLVECVELLQRKAASGIDANKTQRVRKGGEIVKKSEVKTASIKKPVAR
jgi:integrase